MSVTPARGWTGRDTAALLCRACLAAVFLFSAYTKLVPPGAAQNFAFSIKAFKVLPDHLVTLSAFVIPWTELLCAACVLIGAWTRAAALVLVTALGAFTAAVVRALLNDFDLTCSCFGNQRFICPKGPVTWCKVFENGVILLPALGSLALGSGRAGVDALLARRGPAAA